ncbi:hypothetical protein Aru02nite_71100 [Actinocatenispora rupis]|uniref:Uncharacterized protein n=1 Tax=Actinocatenispora rupis TaxID=519421 RepID=A0A8J3NEM0_9ACTN|nr:hypothetical protein Aru02nite_71100 [Actinocatenispora rupis]
MRLKADPKVVGVRTEDSAHTIGRNRTVLATSVLQGTAQLAGYPFCYLAVYANGRPRMGVLLAAAEELRRWGWELVNVVGAGEIGLHAVLYRAPAPGAERPHPPGTGAAVPPPVDTV